MPLANKPLHYSILGILILVCILGYASRSPIHYSEPIIEITKMDGNSLVSEEDLTNLVDSLLESSKTEEGITQIVRVETAVSDLPFIRTASASVDATGRLKIEAEQKKPLARIVGRKVKGYLNEEGKIFATSPFRTSRNLVITGDGIDLYLDQYDTLTTWQLDFLQTLTFIQQDPFFERQLAQVQIRSNGELLFYPQVGDHWVEFGSPANFHEKLNKLRVFYDRIIPSVGWGEYETINLKFDQQIICK